MKNCGTGYPKVAFYVFAWSWYADGAALRARISPASPRPPRRPVPWFFQTPPQEGT